MKIEELVLSIEQMQHLKELGVDCSKASIVLIYKDEDGNEVEWESVDIIDNNPFYIDFDDLRVELYKNYYDAECGDYDHSYRDICGVFTLQEILELLPKKIEMNNREYYLFLNYEDGDVSYSISSDAMFYTIMFEDAWPNMLQGAYNMLCWVAENGFLKTE